jgi:hypothetical protein
VSYIGVLGAVGLYIDMAGEGLPGPSKLGGIRKG